MFRRNTTDNTASQINILLAEDDNGDAKAIRRAFEKSGHPHHITRAVDGIEALEYLRGENGKEKPKFPCILLVDLNMPRMGGIELIREIRQDNRLKQTIIFVISTSKKLEDTIAAYNLNVAGYVTKEIAGGNLTQLVDMLNLYRNLVTFPD